MEDFFATFNDVKINIRLPQGDLDDLKYLVEKHKERNPHSNANVSSAIRVAIREFIRTETEYIHSKVETV